MRWMRSGGKLRLLFTNEIGPSELQVDEARASNLNYHGMAIPPVQPADDVYMLVPAPGMKAHKQADHFRGMDLKETNSFESLNGAERSPAGRLLVSPPSARP